MKVLYLGYTKCGTKTMSTVFRILGYKCYDFIENCFYLGDEWHKILNDGGTAEDFKRIYSDVDAACDTPVYLFWEEILKAFPDVKLLVMYRDDDAWLKSFIQQCEAVQNDTGYKILTMLSPTCQRWASISRHICQKSWAADRKAWPWEQLSNMNYNLALSRYRQHNMYIQQRAPKDRLHVVNFKDGWEPICKFLGKPIPDVPFPHANQGGEVLRKYQEENPIFAIMHKEKKISLIILYSAAIAFFAFIVYFLGVF